LDTTAPFVHSAWPLLSWRGGNEKGVHAVEKRMPAHGAYTRTRQLGGSLVDGLPGHNASRCIDSTARNRRHEVTTRLHKKGLCYGVAPGRPVGCSSGIQGDER
jgi:hypothetical protein